MTRDGRIKIVRIQSRICIGGPALHTEILTKHLPSSKYDTLLVGGALQSGESSKYDDMRKDGLKIQIIDEMRRAPNPVMDGLALLKIYRLLLRAKPDIVGTHTAKAGAIGRLAARLAGVPFVVHTFHGHVFEGYFGHTKSFLFILVERALARLTSRIVALSPRQHRDLSDRFMIAPAEKITTIKLGLKLDKFLRNAKNGALKKSLGMDEGQPLLAAVGRIVPIKNLTMLLCVLRELVKQNAQVHLCFVGDGEDRPYLERLSAKFGLADNVHFAGWVKEVEHIYSGVDVLVLSSLNEGTPVAVIEAMASSVPVVATRVGGVPDLVSHGQNGLLCEPNNISDMAEQIKLVLRDKELRDRLTKNARRFVAKNYSHVRLINEIDSLYESLLHGRESST